MTEPWSDQLSKRYGCRLSADLTDWFDSEVWKHQGGGEFRQPIAPAALLDPAPEAIRPGMMRCDLLPLLSNTLGDWLCVRIGPDDVAAEVIHWYHGGGDWIPWGRSLAEAIAFDAVADRFPSHARRHAEPAESPRPQRRNGDPILSWALQHLPAAIGDAIQQRDSVSHIAAAMLQHRVAETAIYCEQLISTCLESTPDWQAADRYASAASRVSPELAWPWEIMGYTAELRADTPAALDAYHRGAACSAFTDQSIRLATHTAAPQASKFAVSRLLELAPESVQSTEYLRLLCLSDPQARRQAVTQYWIDSATARQQQGIHDAAYEEFVAAGWDIGTTTIEAFGPILERAAAAAAAGGQHARAHLAQTHRRCLREKFQV